VDDYCNASPKPVPLFDAFPHGSSPEARHTVHVTRYLIWQVGPFHVDIRVESTNQSDRYRVTGGVLHVINDSEPQHDITVSLFSGDTELVRTKTDQHGEFSMDHRQPGKLHVRLSFSDEIYAAVNVGEGVYHP
jgi:hypothetical protein